jgi:hypothetical protein
MLSVSSICAVVIGAAVVLFFALLSASPFIVARRRLPLEPLLLEAPSEIATAAPAEAELEDFALRCCGEAPEVLTVAEVVDAPAQVPPAVHYGRYRGLPEEGSEHRREEWAGAGCTLPRIPI